MVGLLSSLFNPQPQNMAPQPSQAMAGQTQQPRGLLGLGGNLGGLLDFNDPKTLIGMQLIANGQKAPGQMFDGVPELAAYGAKMQQANAEQQQAQQAKNATVEFLKTSDPTIASLVEAGALTPAQGYAEWAKKQKGEEPNLINAGDGRLYNPATQEWIMAPGSQNTNPLSAIGKLASDYRSGLIDEEQYRVGMSELLPKGMTVKSDGAGGIELTQGPIGASSAQLPAEMGARIGLGDAFLEDAPQIKADIKENFAGLGEGAIGRSQLAAGARDPAKIWRRIESGRDALVRNLTGAGMSVSEAENQAARYQITPMDSVATMIDKVDRLERDIIATRQGAIGARTGQLSAEPPTGAKASDPLGIR